MFCPLYLSKKSISLTGSEKELYYLPILVNGWHGSVTVRFGRRYGVFYSYNGHSSCNDQVPFVSILLVMNYLIMMQVRTPTIVPTNLSSCTRYSSLGPATIVGFLVKWRNGSHGILPPSTSCRWPPRCK
jgi:hypothetical protein